MQSDDPLPDPPDTAERIPLTATIEVQNCILTASNELDGLQTMLADACNTLMHRFQSAASQISELREETLSGADRKSAIDSVATELSRAVVALQFQDMASQLINHTQRRLRNCANELARDSFVDDGVEPAPQGHNPVTQSGLSTGFIELF